MGSMAALGMSRDDFAGEHLEVLMQRAVEDLREQDFSCEASHIANAAWACAKSDLRGSSRALLTATADLAAGALEQRSWSLRHLLIIAWAVVLQGAYTPSSARYVR